MTPVTRATQLAATLGLVQVEALDGASDAVSIEDFLRHRPDGVWVRPDAGAGLTSPVLSTLTAVLREADRVRRDPGERWFLTRAFSGPRSALLFRVRAGILAEALSLALPGTSDAQPLSTSPQAVPDFAAQALAALCDGEWEGDWCAEVVHPTEGGPGVLISLAAGLPDWLQGDALGARPTDAVERTPSRSPQKPRTAHSAASPPALSEAPPLPPLPHTFDHATPELVLFPDLLGDRLEPVRAEFHDRPVTFAYSVKTNPDAHLIRSALDLGMDMEVITHAEAGAVTALGADPGRLIINGPGKWWPRPDAVRARAVFINSLPEFDFIEELLADGVPMQVDVLGIRMQVAAMASRFGIRVDGDVAPVASRLKRVAEALGAEWGVHFHHAQSSVGTERWVERCLSAMRGAERLADTYGTAPRLVDFGGGWHARDLDGFAPAVRQVVAQGPPFLSAPETQWVFELGKSLVEPLGVVFTRVLVPDDGTGQVVIDACWGDLFECPVSAHRVLVRRDDAWEALPPGEGTLFGRTCMEHDILARHLDTTQLVRGDLLAFADAGGYDVSLSFEFATGRTRARGTVS